MSVRTNRIITPLIVVFVLVTIAPTFAGSIIYVDVDAPGTNDGSSWADAYNLLQYALAGAQAGDEIRVAQGIYRPGEGYWVIPESYWRIKSFQLINGVTIKGGYAGFGEPDPNARDIDENETILSGDLAGDDIELTNPADMWREQSRHDNSEHVVASSECDQTTVLDGFTVTAGKNGNLGAGMYNRDSNPTVTNCTFTWNCAEWGGGMCNWNSSPKVINCKFVSNAAAGGGGIDNVENSNPILINCTFSGNSGFWRGGGMLNGYAGIGGSANPILINCIFSGNTADRHGGGIYNEYSSPIITNCTFSNNSADFGGGMANASSSPILTNCTFSNNSADSGGGLLNIGSSLIITNCMFNGNTALTGGGMYNYSSSPTITNCTFSGNLAVGEGGGMENIGGEPTLKNCTIIGNEADHGGGICCLSGHTIITNSIFGSNTGDDIYAWSCSPSPVSPCCGPTKLTVSFSCPGVIFVQGDPFFGDPTVILPEGNIDADPCFVEPGFWDANGVWVDGDYHLLPDSPCIDAGDPNYVVEPNETDLDGKPRVIGGRIDMGAYEFIPLVAEVRIIPRTINLNSKGKWITCYIWLPEGYDVTEIADIESHSILLGYEIEPAQLWLDEKEQIVIARFSREDVQAILDVGQVELSIIVQLTDGTYFEGTDVIRVIHEGGGKLAKFVQASNPNPADGATNVSITADLSWTASPYATSHNVYFGTSSQPPFVCNQTVATFDPGTMDYETTYYWHIDEVSKWGITTGQLWRFTTLRRPGPGTGPRP